MNNLQQAIKREFPEAGESQIDLCAFLVRTMRASERKECVPNADMQKIARQSLICSVGGDLGDGKDNAAGMSVKRII